MQLTDHEMISAIRLRNEFLIGKIYSYYRGGFCSFIKDKLWKGDYNLQDIYQDAFMILCNKIFENKLNENTLTSSLKTYLFSVGTHLVQNLNRKKGSPSNNVSGELPDILEEETGFDEENEKIIQTAVYAIGEPCHTILVKQYWENKSGEEIADEMNYKNKDAAKTQKYKCIQKLKKDLIGKIAYQN